MSDVSIKQVSCFAFRELDGTINLDSIADTIESVRFNVLEVSMGWRFNHPSRYSQDEEWGRMLTYGKVVPVSVTTKDTKNG